jgi:hypothetical protein
VDGPIDSERAAARRAERARITQELRSASSEHIAELQDRLAELRRSGPDYLKAYISEFDEAVADIIGCLKELDAESVC